MGVTFILFYEKAIEMGVTLIIQIKLFYIK